MAIFGSNGRSFNTIELPSDPAITERMKNFCAFSSQDFSENLMTRVFYGIVFGWGMDDEPNEAAEIFKSFGWTEKDVEVVRKLHECFVSLEKKA
jgi:hypothetical protein